MTRKTLHLDYVPPTDVNTQRPDSGHETDTHELTAEARARQCAEWAYMAVVTLRRADKEYLASQTVENDDERERLYQLALVAYKRAMSFYVWAGCTLHYSATKDEREWFVAQAAREGG